MDTIAVRFQAEPGVRIMEYQSDGAAGADIRAHLKNPLVILPGERFAVPTGVKIELPQGWEAQIRPRSGLALKNGVTCLNSPGTIDSDYRGEIKVILANLGNLPFEIADGDRIAQIVISPVTRASFVPSETLNESERGSGGFGSTGAN